MDWCCPQWTAMEQEQEAWYYQLLLLLQLVSGFFRWKSRSQQQMLNSYHFNVNRYSGSTWIFTVEVNRSLRVLVWLWSSCLLQLMVLKTPPPKTV